MAKEHESEVVMTNDDPNQLDHPTDPRPTPPPAGDDLPDDPDELKEHLRKARTALAKTNRENAERRRKLEEVERQEEERKNASLGEVDRLKKEAKEERTKRELAERKAETAAAALEQKTIDIAVERMAAQMGFEYPDIVPSLIKRDRVEINEEGEVEGIKTELERLAKARPGLVNAAPSGGTPPREGPRRYGTDRERERTGSRNSTRSEVTVDDELNSLGGYDY